MACCNPHPAPPRSTVTTNPAPRHVTPVQSNPRKRTQKRATLSNTLPHLACAPPFPTCSSRFSTDLQNNNASASRENVAELKEERASLKAKLDANSTSVSKLKGAIRKMEIYEMTGAKPGELATGDVIVPVVSRELMRVVT